MLGLIPNEYRKPTQSSHSDERRVGHLQLFPFGGYPECDRVFHAKSDWLEAGRFVQSVLHRKLCAIASGGARSAISFAGALCAIANLHPLSAPIGGRCVNKFTEQGQLVPLLKAFEQLSVIAEQTRKPKVAIVEEVIA